jgi:hypothetical protein
MSNIAEEIFSKHLALMIPTSNNKTESGFGRDLWTLNPDYDSSTAEEMYKFLGMWIAYSARTTSALNYKLSPIFWKKLTNEKITINDFIQFDVIFKN